MKPEDDFIEHRHEYTGSRIKDLDAWLLDEKEKAETVKHGTVFVSLVVLLGLAAYIVGKAQ